MSGVNEQLLHAKTYEDFKKIIPAHSALARKTGGMTPICWLAKNGKWNLVEALATKNQTNHNDPFDYSAALALAISQHKNEAVRALIQANTPLNKLLVHQKNTMNLFQWALFHNNLDAATDLLAKHPDLGDGLDLSIKYIGKPLILHLANQGNWSLLLELAIPRKTDENDSFGYGTALALAIQKGETQTACKLIDINVPLDQRFHATALHGAYNLLHLALINKNSKVAQALIKKCPSLVLDKIDAPGKPQHGKTALHLATDNKDFATINLIANVVNSDPDNVYGINEALAASVSADRIDCIQPLLKAGADSTKIDNRNTLDKSLNTKALLLANNVKKLDIKFDTVRNFFFAPRYSRILINYLLQQVREYEKKAIGPDDMINTITEAVNDFVRDRYSDKNYQSKVIIPLLVECNLISRDGVKALEQEARTVTVNPRT